MDGNGKSTEPHANASNQTPKLKKPPKAKISHEICGYVCGIVHELIKRHALQPISTLKDAPQQYWKNEPRACSSNQWELLASKHSALDFGREYFTAKHIVVTALGSRINEADFLACLCGPVLCYTESSRALQAGGWEPPDLIIDGAMPAWS